MVEPALLAAQPQADTLQSPGPDSYEADLADDEVLELLSRVEAHRRMQSTNVRKESSTQQVAKLEHGSLDSPCIRTEGNISRIDSSRILSKDERDLANRTRKVEDPVIVKQNLAQVPGVRLSHVTLANTCHCRRRKPRPAKTGSIYLEPTSRQSSREIYSSWECETCWTPKATTRKMPRGQRSPSSPRSAPSSKGLQSTTVQGCRTRIANKRLSRTCCLPKQALADSSGITPPGRLQR